MTGFDWSPHLEPDEDILWDGQPDRRLRLFLSAFDSALVPLSFALIPFFAAAAHTAFANEVPLDPDHLSREGSILATLLCFRLAFGRAIIDMIGRRATVYGITNRRVLIAKKTRRLLDQIEITPDLMMDAALGRFTKIRFNHAIKRHLFDRSFIEWHDQS